MTDAGRAALRLQAAESVMQHTLSLMGAGPSQDCKPIISKALQEPSLRSHALVYIQSLHIMSRSAGDFLPLAVASLSSIQDTPTQNTAIHVLKHMLHLLTDAQVQEVHDFLIDVSPSLRTTSCEVLSKLLSLHPSKIDVCNNATVWAFMLALPYNSALGSAIAYVTLSMSPSPATSLFAFFQRTCFRWDDSTVDATSAFLIRTKEYPPETQEFVQDLHLIHLSVHSQDMVDAFLLYAPSRLDLKQNDQEKQEDNHCKTDGGSHHDPGDLFVDWLC